MRSLGKVLAHSDGCPCKKRKSGNNEPPEDTHTQRKGHVRSKPGREVSEETNLANTYLRLLTSRIVRKYVSVV